MRNLSRPARPNRFGAKREQQLFPELRPVMPFFCKKFTMKVRLCRIITCEHFKECIKNLRDLKKKEEL